MSPSSTPGPKDTLHVWEPSEGLVVPSSILQTQQRNWGRDGVSSS